MVSDVGACPDLTQPSGGTPLESDLGMICAIAATLALLSATPLPSTPLPGTVEPESAIADAAPVIAAATPEPDNAANADSGVVLPSSQGSTEEKPPTPVHTGFKALFYGLGQDVKHLPSKPNLYVAAIGGAAALAVHPIDDDVNIALKSHYNVVNNIYKPAHIVGESPVMMGVAILTYAVGRIGDKPKASHLGMDLLRAQIIDEVLTEALKHAVHRERPNASDNLSFPSGHSSVTFATATVIERHLGWKMSVLGYTFAAYIASSRLHDNVHWLSDVVFGAAVGTISGRTVTEHGRNFWTFAPIPVPGGGVALMATRTRK
jgi:hypothetical protein